MINKGIIPINKPKDWTSFDVVNKVKHILKTGKVGHLGTLDPMATGVLLVTVGKATKLFDLMQQKHKTYVAEFEFGHETDTLDATGQTTNLTKVIPNQIEIEQVLPQFIGKIMQVPPRYSAKSVNGVRAYDLARQNVEFDLPPKQVEIYDLSILSYQNNLLTLKIECGSGTYIRSLGRDIAKALNSLATMTRLTRTQIGKFDLSKCVDIQNITLENNCQIKIKDVLDLPMLSLNEQEIFKLRNGQTIKKDMPNGLYQVQVYDDTEFLVKITDFEAKMDIFLGI